MTFSFENLKVYRDSLTWVTEVNHMLKELGKHCSRTLKDQLQRASLSIPLNFAEGNGRWHKAEKKQFYWTARGSVFECVAILQVMARMDLLRDEVVTRHHNSLTELSKMLTALIRSVDNLKDKPKTSNEAEA
ncbi:MAG: four helix bundle protein [Oligoflexales bacterium]